MSADEDTELRDLVAQTLETNGVLGKIRAQLRASVFLALEEQESTQNKTPFMNKDLKSFLDTEEGKVVTSLVCEFLEFFHLDYTKTVFEPEAGSRDVYEGRPELARSLHIIESSEPRDVYEGRPELARSLDIIESGECRRLPLLAEIVKRSHAGPASHAHPESNKSHFSTTSDTCEEELKDMPPQYLQEAKEKFMEYDADESGSIDKDELRRLFCDIFPDFNRNMLDRYVNDEFRAYDKDFSAGIDFEEFLDMYKRLFVLSKSVVSQDVHALVKNSPRSITSPPPPHQHKGKPAPTSNSSAPSVAEMNRRNKSPPGGSSSAADAASSGGGGATSPPPPRMPSTPPPERATSAAARDLLLTSDADDDSFFDDKPPGADTAFAKSKPTNGAKRSQIPRKIDNSSKTSGSAAAAAERQNSGDKSAAYEYEESPRPKTPETDRIRATAKKNSDLSLDAPDDDDYDDDFDSYSRGFSSAHQTPRGSAHLSPRSARSAESVSASIPEEIDDEELDEELSGADELLASDMSNRDDLTTDRTVSPTEISQAFDYVEQVQVQ